MPGPVEASWGSVDRYLEELFRTSDPALAAALRESEKAGLPSIQVSPVQGRLLYVLARTVRARRVLEVGTLGGYSTIWLGRALPPGGRLLSLEIDPAHAQVARRNVARAGLAKVVEVRVGPALETLPRLAAEGEGPFDLVFVDADKPSTAEYFDWAVRLSRPGGLIVVDNVVRQGQVANARSPDPRVRGMRRFFDRLAADRRVVATVVPTVGSKGYDGFAVALVARPSRGRRGSRSSARASRAG